MPNSTTFQQYLQSAFTSGSWSTDEVIEFVLPLFEEVLSFHENNLVGSFDMADSVIITNGRLDIDEILTHTPIKNLKAIQELLDFQTVSGYKITDRIAVDEDVSNNEATVVNQNVQTDRNQQLTHPVYILGYQCYEIRVGHHDAQSDIFSLGLILGSVVMGLDLYDIEDLNQFAIYRDQPAGLNSRMHPTICVLVTEMTELDRNQRSPDLREIIQRLRHYRDYDPQRQMDLSKLATFEFKKKADRRTFILSKLRNRLFDTSRRNRLLYYKPNTRFVNLTVSSVPMVLNFQSINPQMLFTWNKEISDVIIKQNDIPLNKYLRFEDHPYLNAQLNSIRHSSENDKKEYGFSQLKMVVAFLHWHNLKESINERIQSPLLLLPVELDRKKSLKEEKFTVKIIDNAALINPILANHLYDLYGITLPESIDFDDHSMEEFFQLVEGKINDAKQGVKLNYIDKPRIRIVHNIARQTINNYRKKLKIKGSPSYHQVDYSYSDENYKPLGLELFRQKVEPKQSSLEFLLTENRPSESVNNFTEAKEPLAKSTYQLTEGADNAYSWDFDICNIVLGNFNYKKMSLVSDYNKVANERIEHPVFNELFSNDPGKAEEDVVKNNPAEWFHVITADPTQSKAIIHSRTGKSYIIQGPPGTGKSQTITNLIADFLARGKTILFVCEKRAALDVVYHRLQQNNLAELCCYIHDSQGDKKEFFKDLRTIYEDFLKNKMNLQSIKLHRQNLLDKLLQKSEILSQYHSQQKNVSSEAGVSTRKLMETLVAIKDFIPALDGANQEFVPPYSEWLQFGDTIRQLATALENTGAAPVLAEHPFSNLGAGFIKAENPFGLMDNLANNSYKAIQKLSEIISRQNIPSKHAALLANIKNLVQDSILLESLAQTNNLQLVQKNNPEAKEFEALYAEYRKMQESFALTLENNRRWQTKFEKSEVEPALQLAHKHEKSFFGFFNGDWRRLKKQMQQSYDFASHQVKPSYSTVLSQLREEYLALDKTIHVKHNLQEKYKVENIDTVYVGIEVLRRKQGDDEIDYLLTHPRSNEIVLELSRLNNTLHQLELQLKQLLAGYEDKSLLQIKDEIASISSNAEVLPDLLPSLRRFSKLPLKMQQFIRKVPLTPLQAEAVMADKTLELLFQNNQVFSGTSHQVLRDAVSGIEETYKELLTANSEYIRAVRRQHFLEHYDLSNTAAGTLSAEQKLFKQQYAKGRQVIEHEMTKTMRYKSIREVASNESGKVLKDVKPVWLMSPLSVSDSLPLDSTFFDVVIYDEASQITLEEGIPALFRAPQSIIVGDDKQMPPSNFFNAKSGDPEDLETIDGENEDEILSADADSLLMQASRKLKSTMLSWH